MRCPFLREAQVKSCTASSPRKLILRVPDGNPAGERCSSGDYVRCSAVKEFHEEVAHSAHCPFLHETLVQYCFASPVTKFVPYSESTLTRCGTDNHRYCELYLSFRHPVEHPSPAGNQTTHARGSGDPGEYTIEGIEIPGWMWYAENHLWLDVSADGCAHIGIDGLLARAIGHVDEINYLTPKGHAQPAVVLTVAGVDLHLVFPNFLTIEGTNGHLRTHSEKLTTHPYTLGWLFEGNTAQPAGVSKFPGLRTGNDARSWMQQELHRLTEFVHDRATLPAAGETAQFMADGGTMCNGALTLLRREDVLAAMNEFFSSHAHPR